MKSIGIYGDSFADPGPDWEYVNPDLKFDERKSNFKSWTMKLTKHYNVSNFAAGGTGIEYSYVNFLKTHHYYDIIIFVRSNPHRYTYYKSDQGAISIFEIPFEEKIKNLNYDFSILAHNLEQSYITTKNISKSDITSDKKSYMKSIFKDRNNFLENDYITHEAITDSIKLRRPDAHIIDAFSIHGNPCMFNVSKADYVALGSHNENIDSRFCHLSLCQNSQMFNIVMDVLSGKTQKSISDHLHKDVFEKYFTISKTKEEAGLL